MSERLTIRLDERLRERLTAFALALGVDRSAVLRDALDAYLAAWEVPTPPVKHQTSVTSDPCACCSATECRCVEQDEWCASCFHCVEHCQHAWAEEWRAGGRVEPPADR